jgi:beta-galactosidase
MFSECSVAGFFDQPGSDRQSESFNMSWRFMQGSVPGVESTDFDDSQWEQVNLPHGLEILPLEASGSVNYQGEAWYRKHFIIPSELKGKRIVLHFEGVMGKSKYWVNGKLLKSHFGGFLPCVLDITESIEFDTENVIAVMADNSDDTSYPPGKTQLELDFAYFGGIYRDVWLQTTNPIHITDPNEVDEVAGGGVFVHFENVSDTGATVNVETHIANGTENPCELNIEIELLKQSGESILETRTVIELDAGNTGTDKQQLQVENPHLWHVDDPFLHDLNIRVSDDSGWVFDSVRLRIGIRSIEFKGKEGFFLNGKPFEGKLIGSNRHQDYAYVGNSLPNQTHWRDAVKLREAGIRVIRCAHYPQDPSFMDACDALGMFVIIATPGWQFWNDDPVFEKRVFCDIRNMVRRDRNRPSVFLWEPILNETNYPESFGQKAHGITHEEYPHPGCFTACDIAAPGQEVYDVAYSHVIDWDKGLQEKTPENMKESKFDYTKENRCIFTREWGDCVANWRAQSSPSRVAKGWGERAQLMQALHYADPDDYCYTCYESLYAAPPQHVGGTLWHGMDHQRGYHIDAFWGGILDATRQPKYSYQMFRSQVPWDLNIPNVTTGPFVYIAHIMHPTSEGDAVIFSNCDEVRLTYNGEPIGTKSTLGKSMPHAPVIFKDVYRHVRHDQLLEAEGLIDGKVVAEAFRRPWDRCEKLVLEADNSGIPLSADGSDFIPVIARMVDKHGEVVRLRDDTIRFSVDGPAEIIGGDMHYINPQKLIWGEAVVLVRAGTVPGTITVSAELEHPGAKKPVPAEISFETFSAT